MSLCSEAFATSDAFATRVNLLIGQIMDGRGVPMAVLDGLRAEATLVIGVNSRARAVLASATAAFAKEQHDRFQPANDHSPPPEQPDPLIA